MERQSKLEEEQHAMAESLKNFQKKANEEKTRANDQVSALKIAKANVEASRQELKDYKEKAGRILQAKDKVIATLREGRHGDDSLGGGVTSAELDEVCQERDALREDLNQTRFRVEQLKGELQVSILSSSKISTFMRRQAVYFYGQCAISPSCATKHIFGSFMPNVYYIYTI